MVANRRKSDMQPGDKHGHLVVIGGREDRTGNMDILSRYVQLAGGERARVAIIPAASFEPEACWSSYEEAFKKLGVKERMLVNISCREDAAAQDRLDQLGRADAVFITGGDQKRLLSLIGGTPFDFAMHDAFTSRGICIGGTSAGASAMSEHMLAESTRESSLPQKGMVHLAAGFGFMPRVIVDQHFSERGRLARLLSVVAQNPYLLGVGIDENTALVVQRGVGIEIIGDGTVTLVDGTHMSSNFPDVDDHEPLEILNVLLHLLPSGANYYSNSESTPARVLPEALAKVISVLGAVS